MLLVALENLKFSFFVIQLDPLSAFSSLFPLTFLVPLSPLPLSLRPSKCESLSFLTLSLHRAQRWISMVWWWCNSGFGKSRCFEIDILSQLRFGFLRLVVFFFLFFFCVCVCVWGCWLRLVFCNRWWFWANWWLRLVVVGWDKWF